MLERSASRLPASRLQISRPAATSLPQKSRPVAAVEWQTLLLCLTIHGLFAALTFWYASLPLWLLPILGAPLVAWHSSYQHEALHGHPTRLQWLNNLLAGLPLMMWVPYAIYRDSHLRHHRDEFLTDPIEDPESFYVTPAQWMQFSTARRMLHRIVNTLAGRLLIGPAFVAGTFIWGQLRLFLKGSGQWRAWFWHGLGFVALIVWVTRICDMPLWLYIACFAYPGTGVLLLRSFAEHHAAPEPEDRTAIVDAEAPLALLFLNNNLHVAHHARPGLPWYELPRYEAGRRALAGGAAERIYKGYREVARRWLFRTKESPVHPFK